MESKTIAPGTPATVCHFTDRDPYEVTRVSAKGTVWVRRMDYKRVDDNGMSDSQHYEYTSNPSYPEQRLSRRAGGRYYLAGSYVSFGIARRYHDYSF